MTVLVIIQTHILMIMITIVGQIMQMISQMILLNGLIQMGMVTEIIRIISRMILASGWI